MTRLMGSCLVGWPGAEGAVGAGRVRERTLRSSLGCCWRRP